MLFPPPSLPPSEAAIQVHKWDRRRAALEWSEPGHGRCRIGGLRAANSARKDAAISFSALGGSELREDPLDALLRRHSLVVERHTCTRVIA